MPKKKTVKSSSGEKGIGRKAKIGKLVLTLKDENAQPITAATRITVKEEDSASGRKYRARGKAGEVTRFIFQLPPGIYSAEVYADGYKDHSQVVTVPPGKESAYEFTLALRNLDETEDEGEAEAVHGRLAWFTEQRAYPNKEFPSDARQKALAQKKRMRDPDVVNANLNVTEIEDPLPKSSFGSIGRFLKVSFKKRKPSLQQAALMIPYTQDDLGWVDETTLRIFEVNPKARTYRLVQDSFADTAGRYVVATIEKPGIYAVIGLPKHPSVLETVRSFCRLQPQLLDEKRRGKRDLQKRICQLILCAPDFKQSPDARKHGKPIPPRGLRGNVCDLCVGIDIPADGLPERDLLDAPPSPLASPCQWLSIGPRNINGRVRSLAIHPANGDIVYAGTANGGVWVTEDAGQSWRPLMHDEGALEIGALAVHLNDPLNPIGDVTIIAGTGEPTPLPSYAGVGILRSTDSGATWTATQIGNERFKLILIDPTTTNNPAQAVVYAAGTPGGLYKSVDDGIIWTLILAQNVTGLAIDPLDSQHLFAGVAFQGIYESTDGGITWPTSANLNSGFTALPALILIEIGKTAPHKMYAKLNQSVYVFDNSTSTWQSLGVQGGTTYGYWCSLLAVDPTDSGIVFAGGLGLSRTINGGTVPPWQNISTNTIHAD